MTRPAVDVVIPTYNAAELVLECVKRLSGETAVSQIIVVDDASADDTVRALTSRFPSVAVVALDSHRGLAHTCNRGSASGTSEFVLFLNNDVFALPSALDRMADALERDPVAASAGGRLVDPGTRRTQLAYQPREIPGVAQLLVRLLGIERLWPRNPWTGQHLTAPLDESARQRTDRQPAGACLMVRRSALESIGGWDERYWMWYDDVDLSRRLAAIGPAVYVPDAVFEHVGAASTRSWRKHEQHLRLYHGTMIYAQAHLSRGQQVVVALTMIGVCAARLLMHAVRRDAAASTYWQLMRAGLRMCTFSSLRAVNGRVARPSPSQSGG